MERSSLVLLGTGHLQHPGWRFRRALADETFVRSRSGSCPSSPPSLLSSNCLRPSPRTRPRTSVTGRSQPVSQRVHTRPEESRAERRDMGRGQEMGTEKKAGSVMTITHLGLNLFDLDTSQSQHRRPGPSHASAALPLVVFSVRWRTYLLHSGRHGCCKLRRAPARHLGWMFARPPASEIEVFCVRVCVCACAPRAQREIPRETGNSQKKCRRPPQWRKPRREEFVVGENSKGCPPTPPRPPAARQSM